jgi:hypothetical protein
MGDCPMDNFEGYTYDISLDNCSMFVKVSGLRVKIECLGSSSCDLDSSLHSFVEINTRIE